MSFSSLHLNWLIPGSYYYVPCIIFYFISNSVIDAWPLECPQEYHWQTLLYDKVLYIWVYTFLLISISNFWHLFRRLSILGHLFQFTGMMSSSISESIWSAGFILGDRAHPCNPPVDPPLVRRCLGVTYLQLIRACKEVWTGFEPGTFTVRHRRSIKWATMTYTMTIHCKTLKYGTLNGMHHPKPNSKILILALGWCMLGLVGKTDFTIFGEYICEMFWVWIFFSF